MSGDDRIVDDYLNGHLPFSAIYRSASLEDRCPEFLSRRIRRRAAPWRRAWPLIVATRRARRSVQRTLEHHPILAVASAVVLAAALVFGIVEVFFDGTAGAKPVLECPGPAAGEDAPPGGGGRLSSPGR